MKKFEFFFRISKQILFRLARAYVYRGSTRLKNNLSKERFCKKWALVNKYVWRFPIRLENNASEIKISDEAGETIFIGRIERLRFYEHGVSSRLKKLSYEYQLDHIEFKTDDVIIDIGANVGELSKLLQDRYSMKAIVIEPEETEFSALRCNLMYSKTDFWNCPVWSQNEEVDFFHANDTGDSSVFPPKTGARPVKRKARALTSLLEESRFWQPDTRAKLLKLEAEGAEPEILLGALTMLDRIDYIAADCGAERGLAKESTLIPVMEILQQHGFRPISFRLPRAVMLFENMM